MASRKRVTKFDRCLKAVKAKGGAVSPGAVCQKSVGRGNPHRKRTKLRKPTKRNSGKSIRTNPEGAAVEAYREFHGKDPTVDIIVDTPVHFHKVLAGMARLIAFDVKREYDGGKTTIKFGPGAMLAENEKKNQLFIRGGDQSVNLKDFGIWNPHEFEVLGTILSVDYYTEKKHLIAKDGGKGMYRHPFRVPRPTLIYDVRSKLLTVAGGGYTIPSEGIDG